MRFTPERDGEADVQRFPSGAPCRTQPGQKVRFEAGQVGRRPTQRYRSKTGQFSPHLKDSERTCILFQFLAFLKFQQVFEF
jgi:hypothetical protein